jgi:hypothetical protein
MEAGFTQSADCSASYYDTMELDPGELCQLEGSQLGPRSRQANRRLSRDPLRAIGRARDNIATDEPWSFLSRKRRLGATGRRILSSQHCVGATGMLTRSTRTLLVGVGVVLDPQLPPNLFSRQGDSGRWLDTTRSGATKTLTATSAAKPAKARPQRAVPC